ncbi:hypothetical protein RUM43_011295 [Polyplax serrata]|uniref:Uncharacterized protein n=1 Tax=Polyplax serrata TaxID=468196 RepID=A0AAN8PEZ0_POLSC
MICACFFAIPISLKTEEEKRKGQTGSWRQEKDDDGQADDDERAELEKKKPRGFFAGVRGARGGPTKTISQMKKKKKKKKLKMSVENRFLNNPKQKRAFISSCTSSSLLCSLNFTTRKIPIDSPNS